MIMIMVIAMRNCMMSAKRDRKAVTGITMQQGLLPDV
jgi:hypothetical protein